MWEAKLSEHKTAWHGHDRTIYIGPQAQDVLTPFLLRGADDYCFSPAEALREMRVRRNAATVTPLSYGNRVGTNRVRKPSRAPDAKYTTQSYGRAVLANIVTGLKQAAEHIVVEAVEYPILSCTDINLIAASAQLEGGTLRLRRVYVRELIRATGTDNICAAAD